MTPDPSPWSDDPADDRVRCPRCDGERDQFGDGEECGTCRGRGWVREDEFAELVEDESEEESDDDDTRR